MFRLPKVRKNSTSVTLRGCFENSFRNILFHVATLNPNLTRTFSHTFSMSRALNSSLIFAGSPVISATLQALQSPCNRVDSSCQHRAHVQRSGLSNSSNLILCLRQQRQFWPFLQKN